MLCCADEAALCAACDEEVHAANKLAGKHQRVPLLSDSPAASATPAVPKCDICQVSPLPRVVMLLLRSCASIEGRSISGARLGLGGWLGVAARELVGREIWNWSELACRNFGIDSKLTVYS